MRNVYQNLIHRVKFERNSIQSSRLYRRLAAFSVVVAMVGAFSSSAAVTNKNQLCGFDEHSHGDGCYVHLICELETPPEHVHDEACAFSEESELVCVHEEPEENVFEGHTHVDDCFEIQQGELTCVIEETEPYSHTEECYDEDSMLICGNIETEGHSHDEACFETVTVTICGETEAGSETESETEPAGEPAEEPVEHVHGDECYSITRTYECEPEIPEDAHFHTADCYVPASADDEGAILICALIEHEHTADCYDPADAEEAEDTDDAIYFCGFEEHEHDDDCYDDDSALICELVEHTHDETCLIEPVESFNEDNDARVVYVIELIDALLSSGEVMTLLEEISESDDWAQFIAVREEIALATKYAYVCYEDLGEELQQLVTNADKLLELFWLYEEVGITPAALGINGTIDATVTVYQINEYSSAQFPMESILVSGIPVRDIVNRNMLQFTHWKAIVVEKNGSGELVVTAIHNTDGISKLDLQATTPNGFIILTRFVLADVAVDAKVTVNGFDYTSITGVKPNGFGTVVFENVDESADDLQLIQTASTNEFIELNLYNYGSNINNVYSRTNGYPGFQWQGEMTSVTGTGDVVLFGNVAVKEKGINGVTGNGGLINTIKNAANSPISGAVKSTLVNRYPVLTDNNISLEYLYSDNTYATKYSNVDGLFLYDEHSGMYRFNSQENHAQFVNDGSDSGYFKLYKQTITPNFMAYRFGNFLPFNDIESEATKATSMDRAAFTAQKNRAATSSNIYKTLDSWLSKMPTSFNYQTAANVYTAGSGVAIPDNLYNIDFDKETDFFFGMDMHMEFMQPLNGKTGIDGNQRMVYEFMGDDDVLVYIDGVLFLDLSGIHRQVGGKIDFENGEVTYYSTASSPAGTISNTIDKTVKFADIPGHAALNAKGTFVDYSRHTFDFYYMERGSGSGVCQMNFNMPLLKENSLSVTKELTVDYAPGIGENLPIGNPDFMFQILKSVDGTAQDTDIPLIGAGVDFKVYSSSGSNVFIRDDKTDANGVFIIRSGETAVFAITEDLGNYYVRELLDLGNYDQYGTITVNGEATFENDEIVVGTVKFYGVESPVYNATSRTVAFTFNNKITVDKLGALTIKKTTSGKVLDDPDMDFEFKVTLGGAPVPVGTKYMLYISDTDTGTTQTVTKNGYISLKAGQKAVISNIIVGTAFTVEEVLENDRFEVTYTASATVDGKAVEESALDTYVKIVEAVGDTPAYVAGTIKVVNTVVNVVINNHNPFDARLPETGGAGVTPFILVGLTLSGLSGGMLLRRKRKEVVFHK